MNTAVKRRSSPKLKTLSVARRERPSRVVQAPSSSSWRNETLAVGLAVSGIFLFLAFLNATNTFSLLGLGDISLGSLGDQLGVFFVKYTGLSTLWFCLASVLMAFSLWTKNEEEQIFAGSLPIRVSGALGLCICVAGLFHLGFRYAGGGALGVFVAQPLARLLGGMGATLLFSGLALASTCFLLHMRFRTLVSEIASVTVLLLSFVFYSVPLVVLHSAAFIFGGMLNLIQAVYRNFLMLIGVRTESEYRLREDFEPRNIPTPRVRKTRISQAMEGDPSLEQEESEPEEETYSHVLVQRKNSTTPSARESQKAKKLLEQQASESLVEDASFSDYRPPDVSLLTRGEAVQGGEDDEELLVLSRQIESKLKDFGIMGRVTQVHPGPVITLFEFEPAAGVKVGRIAALQDDLAMSLKATSIRIIAPIPKRGTVGIEIPNRNREIVRLRECLEHESFLTAESSLSIPLGKDTYGDPVVVDIALMPHLLMAGATGTGKSVCINAFLLSLLYRAHPSELGLIMIDPKVLELSVYDGIPHLRVPVVTVPKQAKAVLDWAVKEMDRRYRLMQKFGVRSIDGYNKIIKGEADPDDTDAVESVIQLKETQILEEGEELGQAPVGDENLDKKNQLGVELKPLPKLLIVIDELADLMLTVGKDIEELITRLAQKARAAGIHLIVATQRPSVDVITGLIKANFPARLSFRVTSRIDSRTILDQMGAEKLLGRGDMLFMPPGTLAPRRIHGCFVSDTEVKKVVAALKSQSTPHYDVNIMSFCEKAMQEDVGEEAAGAQYEDGANEYDPLYDKAVELVVQKGAASTSMVQRVFRIGYNRAARIIEMMEKEGVIGPMDGIKPREVLLQHGVGEAGVE